MSEFYDNTEMDCYFSQLPVHIKSKIVESGVTVNSLDELKELSHRIQVSNEIKGEH